jgi:hypothetical protein
MNRSTLWVLVASAFLLTASSPSPTLANQQQPQTQPNAGRTKEVPSPPIPARIVPAEVLHPTPAPQGQIATAETKHPPEQSCEAWQLWIRARLWEVDWSNWALLAVAFWAGRAAWRTVGEMRSQATTQAAEFAQSFAKTQEATEAATRQAKASEDALVLTRRPHLTVRSFAFVRKDTLIDLQFQLVNTGASIAVVLDSNATLYVMNQAPLPMQPMECYQREGDDFLSKGTRLFPGVAYPIKRSTDLLGEAQVSGFLQAVLRLYALGFVQYADSLGLTHRTAFCRLFNQQTGRFDKVDNPDYEHAE